MVDIMIPWVIYIISFLTGLCTGHFMGLNNVTACYTNLDEFLELNCTVSQQIEVRELYFVTKKSDSTDCKPPIANASFFDGCCSYSNDDCAVDVFTASGKEDKYNYILQSCTRRNGCKEKVGWIASHGACNASIYFSYSTYMMARYECIADDLIIANSSDAELTNQVIYLQNGEGTSQVACTVESACGTTVVITAIDVNLTCDAGTINCNHNNDYRIKEILESSDHFLQLEINVTEGHRFWIQLKANDSVTKLTVSCGAKKRNTAQNSCVESTTAITTSDTATSNVTLDTYNVTTTEPATSNVTTPETVTSNITLDTYYNVTTTEPATSDVTAPATSNVATPVTSNVTTPETINVTTPDTSNVTRPETFNITTPATSNVTTSEQATPNVTTPKTYNVTTPEPTTSNVTTPATATSNVTAPETSNVTTPETFNATIPTTSNVTTPETVKSNVTTTATSNVTTPVISNVTTSETATSNITTPATSNVTTPVTSNVTTTATSNVTTPVISNVTTSETATSNITTPATSNVTTPVTSNVTTSETVTSNVTTSGIVTYNVTTPQQANQESTLPNTSEPDGRTILIIVVSIIGVLVIICIIPLVVWWCHIKQRKSFYKLPPLEMK